MSTQFFLIFSKEVGGGITQHNQKETQGQPHFDSLMKAFRDFLQQQKRERENKTKQTNNRNKLMIRYIDSKRNERKRKKEKRKNNTTTAPNPGPYTANASKHTHSSPRKDRHQKSAERKQPVWKLPFCCFSHSNGA